ncbi:hypothetical protein HDU99_010882 [Rhizoclosmatium hyalinum]|nr:hypothetical protein HDU99_010882 [Rhizoclosmatium hyalinum]
MIKSRDFRRVIGAIVFSLLLQSTSAQTTCSWTTPPPSSVNEKTQQINGLSISCPGGATSTAILTSSVDSTLSLSIQLVNGAGTFPAFTLTKGATKVGGTQTLTVSINGASVLTGKTYVIPQTVDIGYLANFDVASSWIDRFFPPMVFTSVLNEERSLLPNTVVNLNVKPSNCSVTISAASAFSLLSTPTIMAIMGPDCSGCAMVDAPMAAAFNVPVISGSNGNPALSDKSVYKMYMRTIANNDAEDAFLLSIIQHYGWKYVNLVTFDYLPYGDHMYAALSELGVTVSVNLVLQSGKTSYTKEFQQLAKSKVSIILTNVYNNDNLDSDAMFRTAVAFNMFDYPFVWLFGNPSGDEFASTPIIPDAKKTGHFYFRRSPPITNIAWRQKVVDRLNNDSWLIANGWGGPYLQRTKGLTVSTINDYGLWYMNAVLTVFYALQSLIYTQKVDFDGQLLYTTMRALNFTGVQGPVAFDSNGDAYNVPAEGLAWVPGQSFQPVGTILPVIGSQFLKFTPNTAFSWASGNTTQPNGVICDHDCGQGSCSQPGTCICKTGWVQDKTLFLAGGSDCTIALCSACINGQCVAPNVCQCNPHWIGSDCSILSLPLQQTSFNDETQAGSKALAVINLIVLVLTVLSAIFLAINRNNKLYRSLDISFTAIQLFGVIIGHIGLIFSTAGPTDANCTLRLFLFIGGMMLQMTALLLKTYRFYTIFDSTNPAAKGNLQFWKLSVVIIGFVLFSIIFCIIWAVVDTPSYTILKNVDGINFYGVCKSLSNGGGYAAVVILGLLFASILGVMILLSALSQNIPKEYGDNKLIMRYAICTAAACLAMVVVQYQNFNEVYKTIIVNAFGILSLQAGHLILVVPRYLKAAKKQYHGSTQNTSTQNDSTNGGESSGFSPVAKMADMFIFQACHMKPGLLSRWVKKMGMYDRRNNILMVQAAASETQPHTPMEAFLLNCVHSKINDVELAAGAVQGTFTLECGNVVHQFQFSGSEKDEKAIQDFGGLLKSLKNTTFATSSMKAV